MIKHIPSWLELRGAAWYAGPTHDTSNALFDLNTLAIARPAQIIVFVHRLQGRSLTSLIAIR
jgi:hypothetical protein